MKFRILIPVIKLIIALFLGFLAAALGVLNFVLNYGKALMLLARPEPLAPVATEPEPVVSV